MQEGSVSKRGNGGLEVWCYLIASLEMTGLGVEAGGSLLDFTQ